MAKAKKDGNSLPEFPTTEARIKAIRAKYGDDHLFTFAEKDKINKKSYPIIPSGSIYFDYALGGGWPKCVVAEIMGLESSGKSTTCLHAIKEAQRAYPEEDVAFIDVEHALDKSYAERIGVDLDKLIIEQPEDAETALNIAEDLVRMGGMSCVVIDSVAGLVPRSELEKDIGDSLVASLATLMGQATRKLKTLASRCETLILFTNQYRLVQIQPRPRRGTPGGAALKYFSSVRVEIWKGQSIEQAGTFIGQEVNAKIIKNRKSIPFREATYYIMNNGISRYDEILDISLLSGEIEKSGTWYKLDGESIGQGKVAASEFLKENQDIFKTLEQKALNFVFGIEEIKEEVNE